MNKYELAAMLDGVQYGNEVSRELAAKAKEDGLVIVYGASDDLMEFDGAISAESDVYDGGDVYVTPKGIVMSDNLSDECEECPYYKREVEGAKKITAVWCGKDRFPWSYDTDIPHATFRVFEDGDQYCMGIVFSVEDL